MRCASVDFHFLPALSSEAIEVGDSSKASQFPTKNHHIVFLVVSSHKSLWGSKGYTNRDECA